MTGGLHTLPSTSRQRTLAALLSAGMLAAALAGPTLASEATVERYALRGYEVFYSPTMAVFAGTSSDAGADLSAWYAPIEHSVVINPSGTITGGYATLYRPDGVRLSGQFSGGTVVLLDPGANCTTEYHAVDGDLVDVSRSDGSAMGSGVFSATLVHHRAWIFGRCLSYAASVEGSIELTF
jgi:hypothetical protein